ncbi:MAG: hypothetical protein KGL39_29010 [Patescibacteria group bacterium]|nr:hypothetical protein [Patescibacteria group bacterium]
MLHWELGDLPGENNGQGTRCRCMVKPYYKARGVTIYHGDCMEVGAQLKPVGMILTDPPYDICRKGAGMMGARHVYVNGLKDMTDGKPDDWATLLQMSTIAVVFHSRDQIGFLWTEMRRYYRYYDLHVWHKIDAPPFSRGTWKADVEYIAVGGNVGPSGHGDSRLKSKVYQSATSGKKKINHPCSKPLSLLSKYLLAYAPSSVFDPFCGGGSTLVAACNLGIQAIGIEREERWCEVAAKWLETGETFDWRSSLKRGRDEWSRYAL